jgi:transposase
MFHGTIVDGKKGPAQFWEKEWGNIKSASYNKYILLYIEQFFQEYTEAGYIFMQDNAPAHRSAMTRQNLARRRISYLKFPPYSPDLNIIEHMWNWMKNWIEERYWQVCYNVTNIPL